ncbi:MAG: hypothetical protein ACYCU3_18795 [Streptosporangiaceae bacterium]
MALGQTWTAATVPPPSGFAQDEASYAIPSFTMASNVILATFGNGADSVAGFYQTSDGGTSWRLAARLPHDSTNPSASLASPSQWFTIGVNGREVTRVTGGGASQKSLSPAGLPRAGYDGTTFAASGVGWVIGYIQRCASFKSNCTESEQLYGTTDNGANWVRLSVP